MNTRDQARPFLCTLPLLAVIVFSMAARAERTVKYLDSDRAKFPSYSKTFDQKNFDTIKFSKRFKIKGWRISDDVYMGGVKAAGDYGPGVVVDKGSYAWGFNHQGVEFQLKF